MLAPIVVFTFVYLVVGVATTTLAWTHMADEMEMAISLDLDREDDRPFFRAFLTIMFVLTWPVVLADVIKNS